MGTAWEEKAGCYWGQSNIHKVTVLRWATLGLLAGYLIHIVWSFLHVMCEHVCASLYMLKLLKPLKKQNQISDIFLSHNYKNGWQRSQSSSVIHIFSPTKLSAGHSCCWAAPRSTWSRDINYNIVTWSLLRLVNDTGWFGCLGKALGSILCSFVFEKRLIFGTGRKLKQCLWQLFKACSKRNKNVQVIFALQMGKLKNATCGCRCYWTHNEGS